MDWTAISLGEAAAWYAGMGFAVFPLSEGSKVPLAGTRGVLEATTDAATIAEWWSRHPRANIGLATGSHVAIDVDDFENNAWPGNEDRSHDLLSAAIQKTPHGRHYLFDTKGQAWHNSAGRLGPRVDVRGVGGYIVVAPSRVDCVTYRWLDGFEPSVFLPPPPQWLQEELDRLPSRESRIEFASATESQGNYDPIGEGTRNSTLASIAGQFRYFGTPPSAMLAALLEINRLRCQPPLLDREVESIVRSIGRKPANEIGTLLAENSGDLSSQKNILDATWASDVQSIPVQWLWPGRLALGKLSLLTGNPGLGKSLVTLDLASRVSRGEKWPDCDTGPPAGNVILLGAEDDPADTVKPRLEAAGADCSRILFVNGLKTGSDQVCMFSLQSHLPKLAEKIEEIGGVSLIVIDPVSCYLGSADAHKNAEVRSVLGPLAALAQKYSASVVMVSHLNKSSTQGEAIFRSMGSLGFAAAARSAWLVAKCRDDASQRGFTAIKNNLAADTTAGLIYTVEERVGHPLIRWSDEPLAESADELLSMPNEEAKAKMSRRDHAVSWLSDFLESGPRGVNEIKKASQRDGHSWVTIQRASTDIGVGHKKIGGPGESFWIWELPGWKIISRCEKDAG